MDHHLQPHHRRHHPHRSRWPNPYEQRESDVAGGDTQAVGGPRFKASGGPCRLTPRAARTATATASRALCRPAPGAAVRPREAGPSIADQPVSTGTAVAVFARRHPSAARNGDRVSLRRHSRGRAIRRSPSPRSPLDRSVRTRARPTRPPRAPATTVASTAPAETTASRSTDGGAATTHLRAHSTSPVACRATRQYVPSEAVDYVHDSLRARPFDRVRLRRPQVEPIDTGRRAAVVTYWDASDSSAGLGSSIRASQPEIVERFLLKVTRTRRFRGQNPCIRTRARLQ